MPGDHQAAASRWTLLAADFKPRRLPATLGTGLVLALVNSLLGIALISLIFQGELEDALPIGIGFGLVASAVVAIVIALGSSFPGVYAGIQDASAAILGLSAASIASSLVGPETIDTVLAMITVTSLATGLVFLLMGYFGLGEIAALRALPRDRRSARGHRISDPGRSGSDPGRWIGQRLDHHRGSGAVLAGGCARRDVPGRVPPGLAILGLSGVSRHWCRWLSRDHPDRRHRQGHIAATRMVARPHAGWRDVAGLATEALVKADWAAIVGEAVGLVAILLIVPISVLLYISALEVETKLDLDMTR